MSLRQINFQKSPTQFNLSSKPNLPLNYSLANGISSYFTNLNNNNIMFTQNSFTNTRLFNSDNSFNLSGKPETKSPNVATSVLNVSKQPINTETNTFSSLVSGFEPSLSNVLLGGVLTSANSLFSDQSNQNLMNQARTGNSQFGANYYAENATQNIINHNNTITGVENTLIGVGSLFGPEGLALGSAAALGVGLIDSISSQPTISINNTSGTTDQV